MLQPIIKNINKYNSVSLKLMIYYIYFIASLYILVKFSDQIWTFNDNNNVLYKSTFRCLFGVKETKRNNIKYL